VPPVTGHLALDEPAERDTDRSCAESVRRDTQPTCRH
jgi:hypothetical protein